jgi:hypothetical protein
MVQRLMAAVACHAQAARMPKHSLERLLKMAAFAISIYSTIQRTQKPFKNLQNSTYELVYPEKGIRAVSEKVCLQCPFLCPGMAVHPHSCQPWQCITCTIFIPTAGLRAASCTEAECFL